MYGIHRHVCTNICTDIHYTDTQRHTQWHTQMHRAMAWLLIQMPRSRQKQQQGQHPLPKLPEQTQVILMPWLFPLPRKLLELRAPTRGV